MLCSMHFAASSSSRPYVSCNSTLNGNRLFYLHSEQAHARSSRTWMNDIVSWNCNKSVECYWTCMKEIHLCGIQICLLMFPNLNQWYIVFVNVIMFLNLSFLFLTKCERNKHTSVSIKKRLSGEYSLQEKGKIISSIGRNKEWVVNTHIVYW